MTSNSKSNQFYDKGKNKYSNNQPKRENKNDKKEKINNLLGKKKESKAISATIDDDRNNPKPMQIIGFSSWGDKPLNSVSFSIPHECLESTKVNESKEEPKKIPRPRDIKAFLDQYVIGQEEAKIALAVAVHNHYIRINSSINDEIEIQKSNILMIGNSGSGKTLLTQTIAKYLDVPFIMVDATTLTPAGIVGKDVEDIAKELVASAHGDVKKASQGIVYIDEIDKIAGGSMTRESHNVKGVLDGETQSALLKLLEGNEIETGTAGKSMFMFGGSSTEKLNTKNILFICGGAFAGIEDLIEKEENKHNEIGFTSNNKNKINNNNYDNNINKNNNVWDKIGSEEIIKFGMMPEIVGRLPVIVKLMPLEKMDLVHILTQPKNALIKQYQKLLDIDGVKLDFSEDALELIAEKAIKQKTGARGLRGIVELIMNKIIFNLPDDEYVRQCVITAECIRKNILPELVIPDLSIIDGGYIIDKAI